ncbi:MAG TPA: class III extradiol ring-cleavage dioxygenase [Myxococcales bacterium]
MSGSRFTRRAALALGAVGAASVAGLAARGSAGTKDPRQPSADRMPVAFVPHGGGPWPFVDVGMGEPQELEALALYLRSLHVVPKTAPKALLMISAHWEERVPTVMLSPRPPMLYDYSGFPPESYEITWPAPGDPRLAGRVRELLGAAGFETGADADRGFDHGAFVPLKLAWPLADVPTVQLSLIRGLDPEAHLAMGRALSPLRDEGVFIIGSGMTYHDLRGFFGGRAGPVSATFDAWLRDAATHEPRERDRLLAQWSKAPAARQAHPREEHLIPLMVIAGAAGEDRGSVAFQGSVMGARLSAYHYG